MLISYNNDYEKVTMGFLSYISDLKDPIRIEEELKWYSAQENRRIYLWQREDNENIIGLVGIEEENDLILLRHIALDPSYRNEGLSYTILDALQEKFEGKNVVATLETASIISKWQRKLSEKS